MAILHTSVLRPTKLELVTDWVPRQAWFAGDPSVTFTQVGAFRFDDPDGEVGVETLLVRAGDGPVLQVPLTYRAAPLDGGEPWFITTMQHSVLGERWVYDGVGDPVYLATVVATICSAGEQAELLVESGGERVRREPTALVRGGGARDGRVPRVAGVPSQVRDDDGRTLVTAGELNLSVARRLDATSPTGPAGATSTPAGSLTGTWAGQDDPVELVRIVTLAEV